MASKDSTTLTFGRIAGPGRKRASLPTWLSALSLDETLGVRPLVASTPSQAPGIFGEGQGEEENIVNAMWVGVITQTFSRHAKYLSTAEITKTEGQRPQCAPCPGVGQDLLRMGERERDSKGRDAN